MKKISDQSYIYGNWTVGDVEYKDLNNDGKIDKGKNTKDDHGDLAVIGNTTPRFSYGISLGAQWKGFDLKYIKTNSRKLVIYRMPLIYA